MSRLALVRGNLVFSRMLGLIHGFVGPFNQAVYGIVLFMGRNTERQTDLAQCFPGVFLADGF